MPDKVVILSCFDTYENRVDLLYEYFVSKGYDAKVVTSCFSHFYKKPREEKKTGYTYLPTIPYSNNLSIKRLYSHFRFAQIASSEIEKIQPDVLYILCPPNLLSRVGKVYKMKHVRCKLILDIIDLWPETLPIKFLKNSFPFSLWKDIRTESLKVADVILTECDMYQRFLNPTNVLNMNTLYLARKDTCIKAETFLDGESIHLCYLGSINNIIDIDVILLLIDLIKKQKPVVLHIIGDGETREELISKSEAVGATVIYYGKVFDDNKKHEIFAKCHFGLNIMKDTVCVGLTIKSIDYFEAGLPIINNIKGDTWNLVLTENIGFNIDGQSNLAKAICSLNYEDNLQMRKRSRDLFVRLFSESAFMKKIDSLLENHNIA